MLKIAIDKNLLTYLCTTPSEMIGVTSHIYLALHVQHLLLHVNISCYFCCNNWHDSSEVEWHYLFCSRCL